MMGPIVSLLQSPAYRQAYVRARLAAEASLLIATSPGIADHVAPLDVVDPTAGQPTSSQVTHLEAHNSPAEAIHEAITAGRGAQREIDDAIAETEQVEPQGTQLIVDPDTLDPVVGRSPEGPDPTPAEPEAAPPDPEGPQPVAGPPAPEATPQAEHDAEAATPEQGATPAGPDPTPAEPEATPPDPEGPQPVAGPPAPEAAPQAEHPSEPAPEPEPVMDSDPEPEPEPEPDLDPGVR